MLDLALDRLFLNFNKQHIEYCLVRDFDNVDVINNSEDIDVLVRNADFKTADKILNELGWYTPRINPNAFGHIQYYKCDAQKVYKLDILKDLYFSDGKYRLRIDEFNIHYEEQKGMRVPTDEFALLFLVLHIVLDKDSVSKKNAAQLERLVSLTDCKENWWYQLAKQIVDTHDYNLELKNRYVDEITRANCVEIINNTVWKFKRRILGRIWRLKIRKNSFAILGVDGTGKSSTIEKLKDYYGNDVIVQYMGFRSYTSNLAKKWATNKAPRVRVPGVNLLMQQLSCYHEMLIRYRQAQKSASKLVLFDRYAWEANDNARNGLVRAISWVFFKLLFPKPDHIIYLYCPTDVSLTRKDDIDDVNGFIKMKERIDSIYMGQPTALILDTSKDNIETVVDKVITYICVETQGYVK